MNVCVSKLISLAHLYLCLFSLSHTKTLPNISKLAPSIIVYHSFMMANQKDMETYVAAAQAHFMTEDHSGSHLGQKLDHNRNISTSVVVRSCVGIITPKMESNQTDTFKGCFPISQSGPLLEVIFSSSKSIFAFLLSFWLMISN